MNPHNPRHEFDPTSDKNENLTFSDIFEYLLPGVEFEEPSELLDARIAVLEALARKDQGHDIQSVWTEYAKICEQIIDDKANTNPQIRAQLQIACLVHKALIFREAKDVQRYGEDLSDVREYANNMHLDEIVEAIDTELDSLTR